MPRVSAIGLVKESAAFFTATKLSSLLERAALLEVLNANCRGYSTEYHWVLKQKQKPPPFMKRRWTPKPPGAWLSSAYTGFTQGLLELRVALKLFYDALGLQLSPYWSHQELCQLPQWCPWFFLRLVKGTIQSIVIKKMALVLLLLSTCTGSRSYFWLFGVHGELRRTCDPSFGVTEPGMQYGNEQACTMHGRKYMGIEKAVFWSVFGFSFL